MATQDSMVAGLFSTPEQYQQAQSEAALNRGVQLAQLDPLQRAAAQMYQGGYLAGGAIGGALGGQDPMLKLQSMRQQVLQNVDQTDPKSLMKAAQQLAQFDPTGARALAQAAQEAALKQSQITKNLREGNAAMLTPEQRNATAIADASGADRESPEWAAVYKSNLTQLTAKDIRTSDQKNFAEATKGGYSGTFNQWLLEQNKSKGTNISSQVKLPTDINALAAGYEKAIEGDVSVKNLASNAKGLINQAATSNNPSAWEAARTQVAKAVGEGKLSNEDIARTGVDPTLIGGVRDWIEKKVVGVPDANTQKALFVVASYLEKNASNRIAEKRNNRIAMARQVNPDVDAASMFPDYSGAVQTPTSGGDGKIVDFKDFNKKVR